MFSSKLVKLRKERKMTQQQLADILHISRATYAQYEIGRRNPDYQTLTLLTDFFGVTTDYLLTKDKSPISFPTEGNTIRPTKILDAGESNVFPVGELVFIPIVAEIPCGEPLLTEDNMLGTFPVDTSLINLNGGSYVWVQAKGDSMINAGIHDGSLVLIRLQPEVENGEIGAVSVDGENATLKRVFRSDEHVTLIAENPNTPPMTYRADRIRVVGKKVAVFTAG